VAAEFVCLLCAFAPLREILSSLNHRWNTRPRRPCLPENARKHPKNNVRAYIFWTPFSHLNGVRIVPEQQHSPDAPTIQFFRPFLTKS
jgi:hypothetical protein